MQSRDPRIQHYAGCYLVTVVIPMEVTFDEITLYYGVRLSKIKKPREHVDEVDLLFLCKLSPMCDLDGLDIRVENLVWPRVDSETHSDPGFLAHSRQ